MFVSLVAALAASSAQTAVPAETSLSIRDPKAVVTFLQGEGYSAQLSFEGENPEIKTGVQGAKFYLEFYGCKENRDCQDLMFTSSYTRDKDKPVTVDQINEFNRDNRWSRGYLDKDGDPRIEMDVLFTDHTIPSGMFREALQVWSASLGQFHKVIGY